MKKKDKFAKKPKSLEEKKPELRKIPDKELKKIFEDHQNLIKHANLSGIDLRQVNLSWTDLSRVNFTGIDLSNADLSAADLSGADLRDANLSGANLSGAINRATSFIGADLYGADLRGSDLSDAQLMGAQLTYADLRRANLSGTNLYGADLSAVKLSGAIINNRTFYRNVKGIQSSVNGIFCDETDSAALMTITPPGNTMQGPNPEAIIESLKRARLLHGYSLVLVGIVLLIAVLNLSEIEFPWTKGMKITPDRFGLLAMPISMGLLILVNSFLSDALRGVRYINNRQSAMAVGYFPWVISRYAGQGYFNKLISRAIRLLMSFHPLIYIYFLRKWKTFYLISQSNIISTTVSIILISLAIIISLWTFYLSHFFQKPILFDKITEEERKDNIEKLTEAVEKQTEKIDKIVEIFKPKENAHNKESDSYGETSNGSKT